MATVTLPADMSLWSNAGPMPEDMTPSEVRLAAQIDLLKREMRLANDRIIGEFGFKNVYTPILLLNSLGIGALLIKVFA